MFHNSPRHTHVHNFFFFLHLDKMKYLMRYSRYTLKNAGVNSRKVCVIVIRLQPKMEYVDKFQQTFSVTQLI